MYYSVLCLLKEEVYLTQYGRSDLTIAKFYLTVSVEGHAVHCHLHDYLSHGILLH